MAKDESLKSERNENKMGRNGNKKAATNDDDAPDWLLMVGMATTSASLMACRAPCIEALASCTLYDMLPYSCKTGQLSNTQGQNSLRTPNHPVYRQIHPVYAHRICVHHIYCHEPCSLYVHPVHCQEACTRCQYHTLVAPDNYPTPTDRSLYVLQTTLYTDRYTMYMHTQYMHTLYNVINLV